jgi:hypothetical protein
VKKPQTICVFWRSSLSLHLRPPPRPLHPHHCPRRLALSRDREPFSSSEPLFRFGLRLGLTVMVLSVRFMLGVRVSRAPASLFRLESSRELLHCECVSCVCVTHTRTHTQYTQTRWTETYTLAQIRARKTQTDTEIDTDLGIDRHRCHNRYRRSDRHRENNNLPLTRALRGSDPPSPLSPSSLPVHVCVYSDGPMPTHTCVLS